MRGVKTCCTLLSIHEQSLAQLQCKLCSSKGLAHSHRIALESLIAIIHIHHGARTHAYSFEFAGS